ncbi:hypothetical protein [uncultured Roseibium sp.]|uniref:hypothetical protein n=1 Tax=uncultured Roseibium sp. TaxID=1936171 RepID=UPI00261E1ADC|nr:hypothetical protein [uncultured Roseibium sp.]
MTDDKKDIDREEIRRRKLMRPYSKTEALVKARQDGWQEAEAHYQGEIDRLQAEVDERDARISVLRASERLFLRIGGQLVRYENDQEREALYVAARSPSNEWFSEYGSNAEFPKVIALASSKSEESGEVVLYHHQNFVVNKQKALEWVSNEIAHRIAEWVPTALFLGLGAAGILGTLYFQVT